MPTGEKKDDWWKNMVNLRYLFEKKKVQTVGFIVYFQLILNDFDYGVFFNNILA